VGKGWHGGKLLCQAVGAGIVHFARLFAIKINIADIVVI
jgi:hypothetical protein